MSGFEDAPPRDEHDFKKWMRKYATELLQSVGLKKDMTVLDYGCGNGCYALEAARIVAPGTVYAMDVDRECLEEIRKDATERGVTNVRTEPVTEGALPLWEGKPPPDAVLLFDVLQMVEEREDLLGHLCELARPGALVSVFPMHIGTQTMLEVAERSGSLELRDRIGMLLNFQVV